MDVSSGKSEILPCSDLVFLFSTVVDEKRAKQCVARHGRLWHGLVHRQASVDLTRTMLSPANLVYQDDPPGRLLLRQFPTSVFVVEGLCGLSCWNPLVQALHAFSSSLSHSK